MYTFPLADLRGFWSLFICALPFFLTYLLTYLQAARRLASKDLSRSTAVVPYAIPVFGHCFSFLWNTSSIANITTGITFVTGHENIAMMWKCKALEAKEVVSFSLETFFNAPKSTMGIYHRDNSGILPQPHPNSDIASKDRYYFHNRRITVGFFSGNGLKSIGSRFLHLLRERSLQSPVGEEWTLHDDLYAFTKDLLTKPAVEAMCGPHLFAMNPSWDRDFWQLDHDIFWFFKGWPSFLLPRACKNRRKLLDGVKEWHAWARREFDELSVEQDDHDPYYGSPLIRKRQEVLCNIEGLNADALASQDLGLLWAENANSIPAVFWLFYETQHRPAVLAGLQREIQAAGAMPRDGRVPIERLCAQPRLQSAYAETLRLYTSLFSLRSPAHEAFHLGPWRMPPGEQVAVDCRVAHMDDHVWNTGAAAGAPRPPHPLQSFWAERFLRYDGDPASGPVRVDAAAAEPKATGPSLPSEVRPSAQVEAREPRFTMDGLAGAWLPFGGGARQCPGKNFAKQEIIISFALMHTLFEIELLDADAPVRPNTRYYGLGTFPPAQKVPFRIRRRAVWT